MRCKEDGLLDDRALRIQPNPCMIYVCLEVDRGYAGQHSRAHERIMHGQQYIIADMDDQANGVGWAFSLVNCSSNNVSKAYVGHDRIGREVILSFCFGEQGLCCIACS